MSLSSIYSFSVLTCVLHTLQIRKSPQARAFFRASCNQVGVCPLELLLWIRTRWGSLYKFLERFIQLKPVCLILPSVYNKCLSCLQAISQFILLADASDDVPSLSNQRSYADFHLSRRDWVHLENIRDVLRVRSLSLVGHRSPGLGAVNCPANILK